MTSTEVEEIEKNGQKNAGKKATKKPKDNAFLNLTFNVLLPVIILNQVSRRLGESGPLIGLLLALSLPFAYGTYEYIKSRKHNWMSIFGLVNILFTGGLALIKLEGIWFAVKEAAFPFILGCGVWISSRTEKPIFKALLWNDNVLNIERIEGKIQVGGLKEKMEQLFQRTTFYFSLSFFISSLLNFILAVRIFVPLDGASESERAVQLNEQIAAMTWQGYVVIALPLVVLMMLLVWYTLRELQKISGLTLEELMADPSRPE